MTGIGLLAAGCTETDQPRHDKKPVGCTATDTTFGIDHVDLSAADAYSVDLDNTGKPADALGQRDTLAGFAPAFDKYRFDGRLASDVAWPLTVSDCNGDVRVTFGRPDSALPHFHSAVGTVDAGGKMFADDGTGLLPMGALADATNKIGDDAGWQTSDGFAINAVRKGDVLEGVFSVETPDGTAAFRFHATAKR